MVGTKLFSARSVNNQVFVNIITKNLPVLRNLHSLRQRLSSLRSIGIPSKEVRSFDRSPVVRRRQPLEVE